MRRYLVKAFDAKDVRAAVPLDIVKKMYKVERASKDAGEQVRDLSKPFTAKGDNVFFMNLGLTYRVDKARASHSFKIDIQNLTNNKAVVSEYYNSRTETVEYGNQLSFIPT